MKKKLFILACILIFITLVFIFLNKAPKININETNSSSLSSDVSNESFELNYNSLTLCIGEKVGFVPSKEGDFTYESSASYIAEMQNNILLGVNLGSAIVKAFDDTKNEAVCDVRVIDAPTVLNLSRSEIVLFVGESYNLEFITDSMSDNSHTFTYGDNIEVVKEDSNLVIKGKSKGTTSFSVTTFNGLNASCTVKVVEKDSFAKLDNFEAIWQLPELPTGCEVTAATMTLRYLGFDIGKCELADLYLPYTFDFTGDVRYKFLGHPRDAKSAGCYAPCIEITINNYLEAKGLSDEWAVENITDTSPEVLYDYVSKGIPVIVWVSSSFKEPYINYWCIGDDGTLIPWMFPEHCGVLVGFDKEKGTVDLADSEYAMVCERSMEDFEKIYDMMMKQAIIVYKK